MSTGRTLRTLGLGLLVAAGAASAAAYVLVRRPVPRAQGRAALKGLTSGVEIIRDRWGVPHIYAGDERDLLFAMGFAQAQDRFWQMEFNRRLASGTLAEVLGEGALEVDRLIRRIGFRRQAEREWGEVAGEARITGEAFAAGVNAYLERGTLPLEFTILRYRPKPWQPTDTLAFGRFMSWTLTGNWDFEILRSWTIERFGPEVMADLEAGDFAGAPVTVPPGTEAKGAGPSLDDDYKQAAEFIGLVGRAMSNNWAVDGRKSVSGKPLLASDPHLKLQMPSIWWEVHVESPEVRAAGAALPGIPGVIIGHNDRIAWGITAAMTDGDDLYVERVNPDNPAQYEYQGDWVDGEMVREEIKVRGRAKPVVEEVLITRHGPVISPAIRGETRTLALRTTCLEEWDQLSGVLRLLRAGDWDEFRDALRSWPAPAQNFVYADVKGNIGYQLAGLLPIRPRGHGVVPSPGWTGEHEWTGFIPFDELPSTYNPPTHWVASANNKIVDDDYPYFLSAEWANGFRKLRIGELLEAKEKLSIDDFRAMQGDLLSLPARELVPQLLAVTPKDEWARRALTFLRAWDCVLAPDSVAACVFEVFLTHLVRRALEEKLGSWSDFFMGRGIHPVKANGPFFGDSAAWVIEKIRGRPDWFEGKTWEEAMGESLASAVAELRRLLGDDVSRWQWGRLHRQWFRHPLGQVRALSRVFDRGPAAVGGDSNTLAQAAFAPYHGYEANSWTASYRQIIDLDDFNRSLAVIPSGQSGHPGSRHYGDMISLWRKVEYHPLPWDRDEVEKVAAGRLTLEPNGH